MPKRAEIGAPTTGRERVLTAAWALFASDGYAEVSMQTIANAAGVNKATLYHHFGDKEQLFVAVLGAEFAQLRIAIADSIDVGRPFRDNLVAVADVIFGRSRSDSIRLMMTMHQHVSLMRRYKLAEETVPPWTDLRELFLREIERGAIRTRDVDFAVTVLFGAVIFQAQRSRFMGVSTSDEQLAVDIVDLYLHGLSSGTP